MSSKKFPIIAALFTLLAGGVSAFDIDPASIIISSESIASPGAAIVNIRAVPHDAWIALDGGLASSSTWTGNLAIGSHMISVWANDYYSAQFPITVKENTKYTVSIRLQPHTGYLMIELTPPDASVYIDGYLVQGYMAEIPVGRYSVIVKKFGYDEQRASILIQWQRTSTLNVSLSPSNFEISSWRVKPEIFNPANKGSYGRVSLSFSVTAPGYGEVEILDGAGLSLIREELPLFKTWSQRFAWQGTDDAGAVLADGEYMLKLSLWPLPQGYGAETGSPGLDESARALRDGEPAIAFSTKVKIDSTKRIVPSGTSAARPGLLYFADPKVAELLPGSAEMVGAFPSGGSLSLGFKIGESTMMAVEGIYDSAAPGGGLAGSLTRSLGGPAGFDLAIFGRFAWMSTASPTYPGSASEAELVLPLAYSSEGFRFGVAPGIVYDFVGQSVAGRVGAGLWHENPGLVAGLSAQTDFGASALMSADNPLHLAAEARLLLDKAPITLLLRLSGDFAPGLVSPAASVGFGVAW